MLIILQNILRRFITPAYLHNIMYTRTRKRNNGPTITVRNEPQLIDDVPMTGKKARNNSTSTSKTIISTPSSSLPSSTPFASSSPSSSSNHIGEDGGKGNNEVDINTSTTIADLLQFKESQLHASIETDDDNASTVSEEESDPDTNGYTKEESVGEQQQRQQNIHWRLEYTFESKEELDTFIKSENCWSYRGCSNTTVGSKVLYRCNKIKRMSEVQCAAGIYSITKTEYVTSEGDDADDNNENDGERGGIKVCMKYLLYRRSTEHTHANLDKLAHTRVNETVKQLIIEQFQNGRKPKKISFSLLDNPDIPTTEKPSYGQVVKVVNAFKKSNYGVEPITMRQLTEFIDKNNNQPNDVDGAFIIRFERSPRNVAHDKHFRFFISTTRLLSQAANATIIHADATYKVTTEKVPLIAVGVTDANRNFHFVGLTLANHAGAHDYALTFNALNVRRRSM